MDRLSKIKREPQFAMQTKKTNIINRKLDNCENCLKFKIDGKTLNSKKFSIEKNKDFVKKYEEEINPFVAFFSYRLLKRKQLKSVFNIKDFY